jgi:sporulation protein YlmC with PRC-barrel domain
LIGGGEHSTTPAAWTNNQKPGSEFKRGELREMLTTMEFTIGSTASCIDGECGAVTRVVVDPVTRELTHLVIEPKHHRTESKLVPLDLMVAGADEPRLSCSLAHFASLPAAEETDFVPGSSGYPGYAHNQAMSWPYYGLSMGSGMGIGVGGLGAGMGLGGGLGVGNVAQELNFDTVPVGEIDIHRGDAVHAVDGEIGRVQGLVISMPNHGVTHILLQEGHLFGRKEVSIPISAVTGVDDGIRLNLSKQQVHDLEPVDIDDPNRS